MVATTHCACNSGSLWVSDYLTWLQIDFFHTKQNHTVERIWVEVNQNVNYPIKPVLIYMMEHSKIHENALSDYCILWLWFKLWTSLYHEWLPLGIIILSKVWLSYVIWTHMSFRVWWWYWYIPGSPYLLYWLTSHRLLHSWHWVLCVASNLYHLCYNIR